MEILIDYTYGTPDLCDMKLEALAEFVIVNEDKPAGTEVSISFIDNAAMAELNERYRGIIGPTDVLSFECDNLEDDFPSALQAQAQQIQAEEIYELGDIAIAPDVAYAQCEQFGNTFQQEIELLLVHGMLHLCGYDHIEDEDAQIMEARERELLDMWNSAKGEIA